MRSFPDAPLSFPICYAANLGGMGSINAMTLAAGTRLGPYQFLMPVGAVGMGELWKARDTRLDRIAAIKLEGHITSGASTKQA
jgi:hypothetical protein